MRKIINFILTLPVAGQVGDNRGTNLSGREAYRLYGQEVVKMLPKYNAEVVFGTHITEPIIGELEDIWDEISVVK